MVDVKYISIKEFREFGFLQEVNRQFFHPLGLALEVTTNDDGSESLGNVWDYRDDPEGIVFDKFDEVDFKKARRVAELREQKAKVRLEIFGFVIQPVE